jgi:hypothetical protein
MMNNQKGLAPIVIVLIVVALLAGGFLTWQYLGVPEEKVGEKPKGEGEIAMEPEYPEEYLIYQDYLKTIGGVPRISDVGIIEGTIISITKSEVCPYPEEKCRIEPYPKDIGVVRIDKIIEYTSYSEQSAEQPIEQPVGEEPPAGGKTTPGYKGEELPPPKPVEYERLQLGQEVPTSFLLTTRPVKVRYVSIPPQGEPEPGPYGPLESELEQSAEEPIGEEPVEHPLEPGEEPLPKTYKPIPREGEYFVFTTKIIEYPETSQKILPGLEIGSKFRAEIHYAGSLYIEEYEAIP